MDLCSSDPSCSRVNSNTDLATFLNKSIWVATVHRVAIESIYEEIKRSLDVYSKIWKEKKRDTDKCVKWESSSSGNPDDNERYIWRKKRVFLGFYYNGDQEVLQSFSNMNSVI